jgi:hypothetical protein
VTPEMTPPKMTSSTVPDRGLRPPLCRAVFSLIAKTMRAKRGLLEDGSAELGE